MAFRTLSEQVGIATDTGSARKFEAAGDIKKGQLVKLDVNSGARTAEPSTADGEKAWGVAAYDAAAGDQVLVYGDGCVVRATAGTAGVASGDSIASYGGTGNAGEVTTASPGTIDFANSTVTRGDYVVGEAVQDAAGANDDVLIELDLQGYFPPE